MPESKKKMRGAYTGEKNFFFRRFYPWRGNLSRDLKFQLYFLKSSEDFKLKTP